MIDQDSDGWITEADLKTMLTSLGQSPAPKLLNSLLAARPSSFPAAKPDTSEYAQGLNFTTFLTLMSERLLELDPEEQLREAFECFDENDMGTVDGKELREWLSTVGDKMTNEEVFSFFSWIGKHIGRLMTTMFPCVDRQTIESTFWRSSWNVQLPRFCFCAQG